MHFHGSLGRRKAEHKKRGARKNGVGEGSGEIAKPLEDLPGVRPIVLVGAYVVFDRLLAAEQVLTALNRTREKHLFCNFQFKLFTGSSFK